MKNKILIIFFLSVIFSFLIYKLLYKENNKVLIIGERYILDYIDNKNTTNFLYDKTNYKELLRSINNNDKIIIKNKSIYLNQLIHSSKYIIIYCDYYCNNSSLTLKNINNLVNKIKSISNSNIYIVKNYCNYDLNNTDNYEFINIHEVNNLINKVYN